MFNIKISWKKNSRTANETGSDETVLLPAKEASIAPIEVTTIPESTDTPKIGADAGDESNIVIKQALPQPKIKAKTWSKSAIQRVLVLMAIIILAAGFRFNNINWDESHLLHPDERYIAILAGQLKTPDSLVDFFDAAKSSINPFNTQWGRGYVYGTLPLFIVRQLADVLNNGCGKEGIAPIRWLALPIYGESLTNCQPNFFDGTNITRLGRAWSGLADILSVLLIGLIGLRLFGWRTGVVASLLTAFSAMLIQQSHFFTVDATANFFIMLSLYACVEIILSAENDKRLWLAAAGAGIAVGCALASKISAWPLVLLVVFAVLVNLARDRRIGFRPMLTALIGLVGAGIMTFGSFRVGQPYAFVGPSVGEAAKLPQQCQALGDKTMFGRICDVGLKMPASLQAVFAVSGHWLQRMSEAERLASGEIDIPFGHQWANRAPITFPLINFVFWGVGLPLGMAVLIGYAYCCYQLLRGKRWWAYIVPVTWVGLYFIYQSTQHVKSMRYLLPIYPLACLCAAIGLIAFWRTATYAQPRTRQWLRALPLVAVLGGSFIWASIFSQIYATQTPRIEASKWMFKNVPTALTLNWDVAESPAGMGVHLQLPVKLLNLLPNRLERIQINFSEEIVKQENIPPQLSNPKFVLNKVTGNGPVRAQLKLADGKILGDTQVQINVASKNEVVFQNVVLATKPGSNYFLELTAVGSSPITARTSVTTNEHWDDGIPMSIAGRNSFGSYYDGLKSSSDGQIQNYGEDEPGKLNNLLNWLDEADYLSLTSNRLYASIPRLPWRFPMTTEYYRALFAGELGYELIVDFHSMPRISLPGIGTLNFNTQEMPFRLIRSPNTQGPPPGTWLPYPTAEEAFSVYDHPRVLIFRKTANYSRSKAEAILGKFDLNERVVQTPLQATKSPNGLIFGQAIQEAQQYGGTWNELFPPNSPLNQSQPLAWLVWLLLIELFGWVAFPIIYQLSIPKGAEHSVLVDGGYAFAKMFGLLLVAIAGWWLASLKVAEFSAGLLWLLFIGLLAAGLCVAYRSRTALTTFIRQRRSLLIAAELVFVIGFIGWSLVRVGNPDLWHPVMGGEKPMDFAYFNAVLKSTYFPPIDPWFANGYLNYYYMGWVVFGTPVKMLGIDPSVSYNLVIPTLFALTGCGAFGVAASLSRSLQAYLTGNFNKKVVIVAGIFAAVFVVLLGNGGQIETILPAIQQLGRSSPDTTNLQAVLKGILKWIGGEALPVRPEWLYWNATRLTPNVPIAEFPNFTFLYADLHAHMMAMPIVMLSLAFALMFASRANKYSTLILGAVSVGALWSINTWDYPIYAVLSVAALIIGLLPDASTPISGNSKTVVGWAVLRAIPLVAIFIIATRAFYVPYLENIGSAYNSVEAWTGERTPIKTYITIYATFALPIMAYLFNGALRMITRVYEGKTLAIWMSVLTLAVTFRLWQMDAQIAIFAAPIVLVAGLAALMPNTAGQTRVMWLMVAGAFALSIFVELYTLRGDIGRMNTVFKFYLQAWILLGIVAAVCSVWLFQTVRSFTPQFIAAQSAIHWSNSLRILGLQTTRYPLIVALLLASLYPLFAIPAKIKDRYVADSPHGLDGTAYMLLATRIEGVDGKLGRDFVLSYDYDAIKWMRNNVSGSPVIMEGTTGGAQYRWGNRFAINTGLPAVVGWEWHQRQQRGVIDDRVVFARNKDVTEFYTTLDTNRALTLLARYGVKYIIVGDLEKAYYPVTGFAKFVALTANGKLRIAYQNQGTIVFEVLA